MPTSKKTAGGWEVRTGRLQGGEIIACPARGHKSRNISTNTYAQDKWGVCACLVKHFPAVVTRRICDPLTVTCTMWTHSSKQHAACGRTVCLKRQVQHHQILKETGFFLPWFLSLQQKLRKKGGFTDTWSNQDGCCGCISGFLNKLFKHLFKNTLYCQSFVLEMANIIQIQAKT